MRRAYRPVRRKRLAPVPYKIIYAAIIGSFFLFGKIAGRKLIHPAVISNAFAAHTVARAARIGTVTLRLVFTHVLTVHGTTLDKKTEKLQQQRSLSYKLTDAQ